MRPSGMKPIICLEATTLSHAVCLLKLGDTLALPVMNHYGNYMFLEFLSVDY